GTNLVAHSAADGSTILVVGSGFVVNPAVNANLPYDPIKDFTPVTVIASSPNVVVVHPSMPASNLAEFAAAVKAAPGKFSFASPGTGTLPHLVGELFKLSFGLDIVHVPFNGAGPAIVSTLAGHTPVAVVPVPEATAHVRSGALRALAVTASTRSAAMPDVPTVAEAGAPRLEAETIQAVLLPAGTDRSIVDRLHGDLARMIRDPATVERFASIGFTPVVNTPDEFRSLIERDIAKWSEIAHQANVKGE
ncbi:MAG TPA: tripartite tricarboxylate transporter substrate-binding protein, partial [Alphaproteobacteria bacterium]|nr:tripartite tricarboxylate transporter substrate-binding protein [Alphaproteobacteria bacterium]